MKIHIEKISKKHNDSIWYNGIIAETDDGKFRLYATGEIRIIQLDKKGEHIGMYDGKARNGFNIPLNDDADVDKLWKFDDDKVYIDMNNWFEVIGDDIGDTFVDTYDEGIEQLKELELTN